jgi:predicted PurR-regulated permease PerM
VLALVIAATIAPIVEWRVRAGWSRTMAAAAATVGSILLVILAFVVSIAWIVRPMQDVLAAALQGARNVDIGWLEDAVAEVSSSLTINVGGLLGGLLLLALSVTLWMLLTFFFLRDGPRAWNGVTGGFDGPRRERLDQAGSRALDVLSGYIRGTAIVSLFGAVTSWLIMALLGLPLAVPIGVLTFFGGFIPYIGSFVTTALAFLVAVATGTTSDVVIMAVYTVVFNLVQGSGVAPIVYGKALSLHPAVVLLSVPIGGAVAGMLGMFLVVPIAAIISATWRLAIELIESDMDEPGQSGEPRRTGVAGETMLARSPAT